MTQIVTPLGTLLESKYKGYSNLDFTSLKNKQNKNMVGGLISGLPKTKPDVFSNISTNFMFQVYDAKILSPNIINNYLKKAKTTLSSQTEYPIAKLKIAPNKTIVDEIMEKYRNEEKNTELSSSISDHEESQNSPTTKKGHFGIVGEIFDKYA